MLWHLFKPALLLENVRQSNDRSFSRLLNRARIGNLLPQDYDKLKSRLINMDKEDNLLALHIFPKRTDVHNYNIRRQSLLCTNYITLNAIHYFSSADHNAGGEVPEEFIPEKDNEAGNLPNTLHLSIGTRGQTDATLDLHQPIPISHIQHTFQFRGRSIVRSAFPLVQCWACTIHKVQGMTLQNIVVDIGSSIFEPGMAYVTLSRVTSLHGLHIIQFNPKSFTPRDDVLEEYSRLRQL